MERPMAVIGFTFFLALTLGSLLNLNLNLALAGLFLLALMVGLCVRSLRKNKRLMTVLFSALAAFSILAGTEGLVYRPLQQWDGEILHLRVQALNYASDPDDRAGIGVKVLEGALPKGTSLVLNAGFWGIDCAPYDILEGDFRVFSERENGDEGMGSYAKSLGIRLDIVPADYDGEETVTVSPPESRPLMYYVQTLRRSARLAILSQPGAEDVQDVMAGMAFGFKSGIPVEITRMFRGLGVSHLLAVSGLHTALLAQVLLAFLRFLKVPRRAAPLMTAGFVLLFVALTGFTPSAVRAGVMSMVLLVGLAVGREPDSLNSLGLALLVITLPNPYAVCDVGLLLSAAATFGILALYPPMKRATADRLRENGGFRALLARPVGAVTVTLAATLPTLPVLLLNFGTLSLISPLSNLLMVPVSSVVMIASCFGACFSLAGIPFLAEAAFWVGKTAARLLLLIGGGLYSLPVTAVDADRLFLLFCIPAGLALVVLGARLLGRRGMRAMALWAVIALLGGTAANGLFMKGVTTLTVLQSDGSAAVLLEREGRYGVVVMGDEDASKAAARALRNIPAASVDFLLLADLDGGGAFASPLITNAAEVDTLITVREGEHRLTAGALPVQGQTLYLDDGPVLFWNDCRAQRLEGGFLRLTLGETRVLLCPAAGDASALSPDGRLTNLAVYTGNAPRNIGAITAQAAVLACDETMLSYTMKGIPQDAYSTRAAARGDVTIRTRGQGDAAFERLS